MATSCWTRRTRPGAKPAGNWRTCHSSRLETMDLSASFSLAWLTLRRNGLRSALTLLGITIGIGAVLTMVAVGNGARASIEDQVAAAGMNVITVTAGNYKMKGEDPGGGVVDHQASFTPDDTDRARGPVFRTWGR